MQDMNVDWVLIQRAIKENHEGFAKAGAFTAALWQGCSVAGRNRQPFNFPIFRQCLSWRAGSDSR